MHVDARALQFEQLRNVALAFMKFEAALDLCASPGRRGVSNDYCKSNRAAHGSLSNKQVGFMLEAKHGYLSAKHENTAAPLSHQN